MSSGGENRFGVPFSTPKYQQRTMSLNPQSSSSRYSMASSTTESNKFGNGMRFRGTGGGHGTSPSLHGFAAGVTPIAKSTDRSGFIDNNGSPFGDEYFGIRDPLVRDLLPTSAKKRPRVNSSSSYSQQQPPQQQRQQEWERQIQSLKQQVSYLNLKLEEQELGHKTRESELLRKLKTEEIRAEEHQRTVDRLEDQVKAADEEKHEAEAQLSKERRSFMEKVAEIKKVMRQMEDQHFDERELLKNQILELEKQVKDRNTVADERLEIIENLQEDLKRAKARHGDMAELERSRTHITMLENKISRFESKNQDLELEIEALRNGAAVGGRAKELSDELRRANEREHVLREKLQGAKTESSRLYESMRELDALKSQMGHISAQRDKLLSVESERDALKQTNKEWEDVFAQLIVGKSSSSSSGRFVNPITASKILLEMQENYSFLQKKKGDLEVRITQVKEENDRLRKRAHSIEVELNQATQQVAQLKEEKDQISGQCTYLQKERDGLLRVLDSVKDEPYSTLPTDKQEDVSIRQLKDQYDQQIGKLKESLAEARARIAQLEKEAQETRNSGASPAVVRQKSTQLHSSMKRIETLEAEKKALEDQLEKALDKAAEMEHHVASGMYNPQKTKILHFKHNPERVALGDPKEEVKALKEEIERLKNELAAAAAASSSSSRQGAIDPNKRTERLKQMFKEKTKAFKEAVYLLTGYKIDMMDKERTPQLRLRSMYAEQPEDELLFQWDANGGGLQLLETEYCKQLDENTFAYLSKCNSVPAFLSTLTLDLFGKQTLAIG